VNDGDDNSLFTVLLSIIVGFIVHWLGWNPFGQSQIGDKGYIYFIQRITGGPIKIGYSNNPQKRLATFQTSHHERLVILGCVHGDIPYERHLHRQFAGYRIRSDGEWFQDCREIRMFISQNCFKI